MVLYEFEDSAMDVRNSIASWGDALKVDIFFSPQNFHQSLNGFSYC